jgi:hypothetical protein
VCNTNRRRLASTSGVGNEECFISKPSFLRFFARLTATTKTFVANHYFMSI